MISGNRVTLSPKNLSDAPRDYLWQKDAELMALNGSTPLTVSFIQYLMRYATGRQKSNARFLSIKIISDGRHIGNCAIYDTDRSRSETNIGIFIGERDYWGKGYGTDAVKTLSGYVFNEMDLRHINLKTLESNARALRCFDKCGFKVCGSLLQHGHSYIMMQLSYEEYVTREIAIMGKKQVELTNNGQTI
jgi:RimJ/RimL family protein N-acetyltransferase